MIDKEDGIKLLGWLFVMLFNVVSVIFKLFMTSKFIMVISIFIKEHVHVCMKYQSVLILADPTRIICNVELHKIFEIFLTFWGKGSLTTN